MGTMIAEPVLVPTESGTSPGFLIYANEALLCIIVRFDKPGHLHNGRWMIRLGFGPCGNKALGPVEYLDEAVRWVVQSFAGATVREDKIEAITGEMERATIALTACSAPGQPLYGTDFF